MYPFVKPSSIEITNALNTLWNLCVFNEGGDDVLELLQIFEPLHVHDANNLAFWLILTGNKIPITVKLSIHFPSPIAFQTYQSQYRSKYSITFTKHFIEGKNFEFSAISKIRYFELLYIYTYMLYICIFVFLVKRQSFAIEIGYYCYLNVCIYNLQFGVLLRNINTKEETKKYLI